MSFEHEILAELVNDIRARPFPRLSVHASPIGKRPLDHLKPGIAGQVVLSRASYYDMAPVDGTMGAQGPKLTLVSLRGGVLLVRQALLGHGGDHKRNSECEQSQ